MAGIATYASGPARKPVENRSSELTDAERSVDYCGIVIVDEADFEVIGCGGCAPPVYAKRRAGGSDRAPGALCDDLLHDERSKL